jgi:hypothetical protein
MNIEQAQENIKTLLKYENEYIYFENETLKLANRYYLFYSLDDWCNKIEEMYNILLKNEDYLTVFNSVHILQEIYNNYKIEKINEIIQIIENNKEIIKIGAEMTIDISDSDEEIKHFENQITYEDIIDEKLFNFFNIEKKTTLSEKIDKYNKKYKPTPPKYPKPRITSNENSEENKKETNNIKINDEYLKEFSNNKNKTNYISLKKFYNFLNYIKIKSIKLYIYIANKFSN